MRPFARLCFQPQWRRCGPQALGTVLALCGLLPQPLLTLSSGPRLLLGTTRPAPGCPDAPSGPPRLPPRWTRSSLVFSATQVLLPAQPLAWYPPFFPHFFFFDLNNRNLFSLSSRAKASKIKVMAWQVWFLLRLFFLAWKFISFFSFSFLFLFFN